MSVCACVRVCLRGSATKTVRPDAEEIMIEQRHEEDLFFSQRIFSLISQCRFFFIICKFVVLNCFSSFMSGFLYHIAHWNIL